MGRGAFSLVIRLIAGAYIIYLGYQLLNGYMNPTEETGDPVWYALVFGIAFLIMGAFIIIDAIRKQMAAQKEEPSDEESQTEENTELEETDSQEVIEEKPEEKSEEIPRTMTIAERIRRLSADDDEEPETEDKESAEKSEDAPEEKD